MPLGPRSKLMMMVVEFGQTKHRIGMYDGTAHTPHSLRRGARDEAERQLQAIAEYIDVVVAEVEEKAAELERLVNPDGGG